MNSHFKDKTISWISNLYNENSHGNQYRKSDYKEKMISRVSDLYTRNPTPGRIVFILKQTPSSSLSADNIYQPSVTEAISPLQTVFMAEVSPWKKKLPETQLISTDKKDGHKAISGWYAWPQEAISF